LSLGTGPLGVLTACWVRVELDDRMRLNNWSIAASYDLLGGIWGIWRTVSLARFGPSPVSSCSSSLLGAHLLEEKNVGRPASDVWSWRNSEAALMRTREEQEVLDLLVKSYGRPLTEQEQWLSLAQARAGRARRSRVGMRAAVPS